MMVKGFRCRACSKQADQTRPARCEVDLRIEAMAKAADKVNAGLNIVE